MQLYPPTILPNSFFPYLTKKKYLTNKMNLKATQKRIHTHSLEVHTLEGEEGKRERKRGVNQPTE